jgi:hypothetical protein
MMGHKALLGKATDRTQNWWSGLYWTINTIHAQWTMRQARGTLVDVHDSVGAKGGPVKPPQGWIGANNRRTDPA